jgi:hypothetical protein
MLTEHCELMGQQAGMQEQLFCYFNLDPYQAQSAAVSSQL